MVDALVLYSKQPRTNWSTGGQIDCIQSKMDRNQSAVARNRKQARLDNNLDITSSTWEPIACEPSNIKGHGQEWWGWGHAVVYDGDI